MGGALSLADPMPLLTPFCYTHTGERANDLLTRLLYSEGWSYGAILASETKSNSLVEVIRETVLLSYKRDHGSCLSSFLSLLAFNTQAKT